MTADFSRYRWRRLNISFSGGRTSAYMTKLLLDELGDRRNVVVTFANTGQEHEDTLRFVRDCDEAWGLNVVWLEARVDPRATYGTRHRVVTYETASRDGQPFADVIAKYGLPGPGYLHCTRELKANVIRSYLRSIGWEPGTYDTAIGIRADEIDRQDKDAAAKGFVYPLLRMGIRKADVLRAFEGSNIDLGIPEELGNCTWCWKKSLTKHVRLMREHPEVFEFPARMEALHAHSGTGDERARHLFRKHRTTADLRRLAAMTDAEIKALDGADIHVEDECHGVCDLEAA